jgi:hypothetical protein
MTRTKDNKERTMTDAAEEIVKRYGLDLPDEMQDKNRPDVPIERDYSVGEKSMTQAYLDRRPYLKPAKKVIERDVSPEIAPGVRVNSFIKESLLPQVDALTKKNDDLLQRINDFEAKASSCSNRECKAFGQLHFHQGA